MLQKLNERIQGMVAWIIISLIAVTFALFGVDYYLQSRQGNTQVKVEVNGQPVTKQAFDLNYRRARQALDGSHLTAEREKQLKHQVLDDMILTEVSVQAARRYGFKVTPEQANAAIVHIPQFREGGHFSRSRYQQALSGALYTPETFQREVQQGMLLNQQRFALIGTAFTLPDEVKQFVALYMQTRNYAFLTIPTTLFADKIKIKDEAVKQYYEQHPKAFMAPEKVGVDYIALSLKAMMNQVKVSKAALEHYYQDNQQNYLTPARWQVAPILFALPEGASKTLQAQIKEQADRTYQDLQKQPALFEQKVSELSDDKRFLQKQGELPWMVAGQSPLDKSLVDLTRVGQISKPVRTQRGYEIFKLLAYQPATVKPFEAVREDINHQLTLELAQADYAKKLELLTDLTYQNPDSLKPAAKALGLTIKTVPPFSRQGRETPTFTQNKAVIQAAFSHDVLALGNNSDLIQIDPDRVLVLRVNQHIPVKRKPLAEVKKAIEQRLKQKQLTQQARQLGEQILAATNQSSEQHALAKRYGLQWQTVLEMPRETDTVSAEVNEIAFNLARPGAKAGRSLRNGSYVIVTLKDIQDGQLKQLDKEQIASITQQLEASYGLMDYDLYLNGLLNKAQIDHY